MNCKYCTFPIESSNDDEYCGSCKKYFDDKYIRIIFEEYDRDGMSKALEKIDADVMNFIKEYHNVVPFDLIPEELEKHKHKKSKKKRSKKKKSKKKKEFRKEKDSKKKLIDLDEVIDFGTVPNYSANFMLPLSFFEGIHIDQPTTKKLDYDDSDLIDISD